MTSPNPRANALDTRVRSSTRTLLLWTIAWLLTTTLLAFGPGTIWEEALAVTLISLGISLAAGSGMIVAAKLHVQTLDELQRKVMLDAMGITIGVVLVVGFPLSVLEAQDVIALGSPITAIYVLMSLTFMGSIILGLRRYR